MSTSSKSSPWVWISLALIITMFVAFILFLDQKIVKDSQLNSVQEQSDNDPGEPVFDFYTVLPQRGVDIPEPEGESVPNKRAADTANASQERYLLQAGSFREAVDAERRKAELALLGLESSVRTASVSGKIYHRVELGPFVDDGFFSRVKSRLIENDIQYIAKSAQ